MRQFRHSHSLYNLPWASKLATSLFLVSILGACGVAILMAGETSGGSMAAVAAFYRGGAGEEAYAKTYQDLLSTAHFHLFSMPVILLIVGHLMGLTRFPRLSQGLLMWICFVGMVLNVTMPFAMLRFATGPWPALKLTGNILMGLALPLMCVLALLDLYLPPPQRDNPGS